MLVSAEENDVVDLLVIAVYYHHGSVHSRLASTTHAAYTAK
jgi:hypothetical protein